MNKGETIRTLRQARAWSQAHLAQAAGVSTRTIQRLEKNGSCSHETLLSIAAALDVDVANLTRADPLPAVQTDEPLFDWKEQFGQDIPPGKSFVWGLVLAAPAAIFILSNILKYEFGIPQLYDAISSLGAITGLDQMADIITSPVVLLGGIMLAIVLNLMPLIELAGDHSDEGFTIRSLRFCFNASNVFIIIGSLTCLAILVGYATMENLADWIVALISS